MGFLVAAVVLLPLLVLLIYVLLKKIGHPECEEGERNVPALMLIIGVSTILSGLLVRPYSAPRLMFDLSFVLLPAVLSVFQVFDCLNAKPVLIGFGVAAFVVSCQHLLCAVGIIPLLSHAVMVWGALLLMIVLGLVMIVKTLLDFFNVPLMMSYGSVWAYVWLCMDCIYIVFVVTILMLNLLFCDILNMYDGPHIWLANVFLGASFVCLCFRKVRNSPFIFLRRHEKVILESIQVSRFELTESSVGTDDSDYRAVYDRILEYFEKEKPFLRSNLTINDLVQVIYSNKLYISRAISLFTGRNFRQFVNYYRVQYSCNVYRENPTLKIVELSQASGFNTVASFNMAFRLFMKETPGEWCRREKVKLVAVGK